MTENASRGENEMTTLDDYEIEDEEMEDSPPPEESSNRTFLLVAGILGGVLLLTLICLAVYAMVFVPRRESSQQTQVAEINAQNTEVALAAQMTRQAQAWTATPSATSVPTETSTASPTPVIAPTDTPAEEPTEDPRTATVAALLTLQAGGNLTTTPTATALPATGFADDFGVPGLLSLAAALVVVIFLARRLRTATS
jgi:septal ring-binding cell division protein DamX